MELRDIITMMQSADYKERFKAEYYQNVIRYQKLKEMLHKWGNGELTFSPTCPRSTYNMQIKAMADYIAVLEARAVMEGINLDPEGIEPQESAKSDYENIYDYVAKNMDGMHGDFTISVTDVSEIEADMLLAVVRSSNSDGNTADFYLHADGREEWVD